MPACPSVGHRQGKAFGFEEAKPMLLSLCYVCSRGNEVEGFLYWNLILISALRELEYGGHFDTKRPTVHYGTI